VCVCLCVGIKQKWWETGKGFTCVTLVRRVQRERFGEWGVGSGRQVRARVRGQGGMGEEKEGKGEEGIMGGE
jgi:hypothetical protein